MHIISHGRKRRGKKGKILREVYVSMYICMYIGAKQEVRKTWQLTKYKVKFIFFTMYDYKSGWPTLEYPSIFNISA